MPLRREAPHDVGERLAELHRIRIMVCQFWQTVRKMLRLGDTPCMMLTRDLRLAGGADYSREGDRAWLRETVDGPGSREPKPSLPPLTRTPFAELQP